MTKLTMPPEPAEFEAIARAAGLKLPPARLEEVRQIYPQLLDLKGRLRTGLTQESEPAHLFAARSNEE